MSRELASSHTRWHCRGVLHCSSEAVLQGFYFTASPRVYAREEGAFASVLWWATAWPEGGDELDLKADSLFSIETENKNRELLSPFIYY